MWAHQNYYAMQGIYGVAAANALAAQSNILGTPFAPHPASIVDRSFPVSSGTNPFAARTSQTPSLNSQHFAMLRSQLAAGEASRIESTEELQKQLQHTMGYSRLFPPFPNFQHSFPANLPPISYYMPSPLERQPDKRDESPQRPNSHTPSSSDRSSGVSPVTEASPPTKSISPPESRKSGNKSPDKRSLDNSMFPSFSMPSNPFGISNPLHQNTSGFLPSLVASSSFFRPYCFPSGMGPAGPHGLVRPPNHLNGSPIIGPLNISPRVPLSPTCLRR